MYHEKYLKYKNKYLALKNNENMTGGNNKIQMILYKSTTCGHCNNFIPTWNTLQKKYENKYEFITFDAMENKDKFEDIVGVPTIKFSDKGIIREYNGGRSLDELSELLDNFQKI